MTDGQGREVLSTVAFGVIVFFVTLMLLEAVV